MKHYWQIRVEEPEKFTKFGWHDVGKKGHIVRISGFNFRTFKWGTQAYRIALTDAEKQGSRLIGKTEDAKKLLLRLGKLKYKGGVDWSVMK